MLIYIIITAIWLASVPFIYKIGRRKGVAKGLLTLENEKLLDAKILILENNMECSKQQKIYPENEYDVVIDKIELLNPIEILINEKNNKRWHMIKFNNILAISPEYNESNPARLYVSGTDLRNLTDNQRERLHKIACRKISEYVVNNISKNRTTPTF